jgi:hypothetical protein
MASEAQALMALPIIEEQALTTLPTIADFVRSNPIPPKLAEIKDINLLYSAIALGHVVEVKVLPHLCEESIDDATFGRNTRIFNTLKKQEGVVLVPYKEDALENFFTLTFKVILNLSAKAPFDDTQIVSGVATDSHAAITCGALSLAYVSKPYDINSLLTASFHSFQKYGLPAFFSADAVRISISDIVPTYDVFARKNVVSPFHQTQSPFLTVQSPVPFEPPQNVGLLSLPEKTNIQPKSEWQTQGRRRHIVGASAEPPKSVLADSYNGKRLEENGWIMNFADFWKNGESGDRTNGRVVPPNERFRKFTRKVKMSHDTLKGKDPNDTDFLEYMKDELGDHFADWSKYNWSEIDLNVPFPENPPMKSS